MIDIGFLARPRVVACLARTGAAVLLVAAAEARAEERMACADRDQVVERLASRFGETLQSMGLNQTHGLVEVYASDSTGSWTILVTRPDGTSCLLASGELWEGAVPPLGDPA